MKITEHSPITFKTQVGPSSSQPKPEADFAKALAEAEAKAEGPTNQTPAISAAVTLMGMSPVGAILANSQINPQSLVNKALGVLDSYSQALADPQQSLKQISPLVKDLENEARNMERLSQSLPPGHGLKPVAESLAVLATVESMKFNRGDYV